jgi:hypothetical protein
MPSDDIQYLYSEELGPLETLLFNVQRPGHFCFNGTIEIPMPKMEIEKVGILSFPIPEAQIKHMIDQAVRAPYGRGKETILDTNVRKVWQLQPETVKISGPSWERYFQVILDQVQCRLGCQGITITAELYKLLIYDQGGFFLSHRDTEKAPGMFGTLVIVLPSFHRGGELIIRHSEQESIIDLSYQEGSQLTFAAFYADCEHEVKPITEGHRVCLVYNLIQKQKEKGRQELIKAPIYDKEITQAATILKKAFKKQDAPLKIVWLLEHQYSSAELSFATLKNVDAARAQVLSQAALKADCAIHLGIFHLEESGAAEINYDPYYSRRYSRWQYSNKGEEADEFQEDFEVIDVCDSDQYIDGWVDLDNQAVPFGKIPLNEEELLPKGSLDNEKPDEQRLMEASGNEGASFERAYRRAALVIWPKALTSEVLLEAGVGAMIPYFKEQLESGCSSKEACSLGNLIIDHWAADVNSSNYQYVIKKENAPNRTEMLHLLKRLQNSALLERFILEILINTYDGTENEALIAILPILEEKQIGNLFSSLIHGGMKDHYDLCLSLVLNLLEQKDEISSLRMVMHQIVQTFIASLKNVHLRSQSTSLDWTEWKKKIKTSPSIESEFLVKLWGMLKKMHDENLEEEATTIITSYPSIFDPGKSIVPAIKKIQNWYQSPCLTKLWQYTSQFLLQRSEYPLQPPKDWRQAATLSCQCEDCKELQKFMHDPSRHILRLPAAKERRQHLHNVIDANQLEMTHETERAGRPYTLVCTKTREKYQNSLKQYHDDIECMRMLLTCLSHDSDQSLGDLKFRLLSAIAREQNKPK